VWCITLVNSLPQNLRILSRPQSISYSSVLQTILQTTHKLFAQCAVALCCWYQTGYSRYRQCRLH
jgi:hypothetical protein